MVTFPQKNKDKTKQKGGVGEEEEEEMIKLERAGNQLEEDLKSIHLFPKTVVCYPHFYERQIIQPQVL